MSAKFMYTVPVSNKLPLFLGLVVAVLVPLVPAHASIDLSGTPPTYNYSISANKTTIAPGEGVTIRWSTDYPTGSVGVQDNFGVDYPVATSPEPNKTGETSGAFIVYPQKTTSYHVTALAATVQGTPLTITVTGAPNYTDSTTVISNIGNWTYDWPSSGATAAYWQGAPTYELAPGQYFAGLAFRKNCDLYSSDDACWSARIGTAAAGSAAYFDNSGTWTTDWPRTGATAAGWQGAPTYELAPGQYFAGLAFRKNCDFASSDDACMRAKIGSVPPGSPNYRDNVGTWTDWFPGGATAAGWQGYAIYPLMPNQYISGIAFRKNCDFYSSDDACMRIKISELHSQVQPDAISSKELLIGTEDLPGPVQGEGIGDYNDIMFKMTSASPIQVNTQNGLLGNLAANVVDESGSVYWGNPSADGSKKNIGYCVLGNGNCPSIGGPFENLKYVAGPGGGQVHRVSFSATAPAKITLLGTQTGNVNYDFLGWYDQASPAAKHTLFPANASVGTSVTFTPSGSFALFVKSRPGPVFSSIETDTTGDTTGQQHFAIFPYTTSAPSVTFSASPTSIVKGSSSTLSWTATHVTSCSGGEFTPSGNSGSTSVSPSSTITYTLNCIGNDGSTVTKSVTVTVTNPDPTATLLGDPSSIILGGTSLLTWSSTGADSCTGAGFSTGGATSGTKLVGPSSDTNYAVTCTNSASKATASKAITVTVKQPTANISSSAGRVKKGDTVTITWDAQNVTSCTITGSGIGTNGTLTQAAAADGSVTGSQDVVIDAQSTYIISCAPSGTSSQSAATVNLAPDFQEF